MTTDKNQPSIEQLTRDLDMARAMEDKKAIARLSAELKKVINKIFTADGVPFPK